MDLKSGGFVRKVVSAREGSTLYSKSTDRSFRRPMKPGQGIMVIHAGDAITRAEIIVSVDCCAPKHWKHGLAESKQHGNVPRQIRHVLL